MIFALAAHARRRWLAAKQASQSTVNGIRPWFSQRSSVASPTIHCTSPSHVVPAPPAGSGTCDVSVGVWVGVRKIRTAHGPAKRTDAPPALTFGLPGKQKVKPGPSGRNLIRLLKDLPVDRSNPNKELLGHGS
jgi:hypothetical protein